MRKATMHFIWMSQAAVSSPWIKMSAYGAEGCWTESLVVGMLRLLQAHSWPLTGAHGSARWASWCTVTYDTPCPFFLLTRREKRSTVKDLPSAVNASWRNMGHCQKAWYAQTCGGFWLVDIGRDNNLHQSFFCFVFDSLNARACAVVNARQRTHWHVARKALRASIPTNRAVRVCAPMRIVTTTWQSPNKGHTGWESWRNHVDYRYHTGITNVGARA